MIIPEILLTLGFGVRSLDFEDFEKACAELKIPFFLVDEKIGEGMTFPRTRNGKKYSVILLERTLFRDVLTEVAFHELYHVIAGHFGMRCFVRGSEEKAEQEANDFSLCCRISTKYVRTKTRNELLDLGFTNTQISRRYAIYRQSNEKL